MLQYVHSVHFSATKKGLFWETGFLEEIEETLILCGFGAILGLPKMAERGGYSQTSVKLVFIEV